MVKQRRCRRRAGLGADFLKDLGGASFMFVAATAVPVVGTIGLSTDGAIGFMVRHRMAEALDAAGLAAGRELDPDARAEDFEAFFKANFPDGFMGANVETPTLTESDSDGTLTLTVSAAVPTTFMRVLGVDDYQVSARTVIERERSGMELSLVMDNTGSMRGDGKIDAMKGAAQSLVDILYGEETRIDRFWISLVPYTSMVNIGSNNALWVDAAHQTGYTPTSWLGCVEARGYPLDTTDDTYDRAPLIDSSGQQVPYTWNPALYPNDVDNYWHHIDYDWTQSSERSDWKEFGQPILIAHLNDALGYPHGNTRPTVDGAPLHFEDMVDEWVHQELDLDPGDPRPNDESLYKSVARVVLGYDEDDSLPGSSDLKDDLQDYVSPHDYGTWPSKNVGRIDLLLTAHFRRAYEERDDDEDWTSPLVRGENHWENDGTGPNLGCGPAITPLTDDRATVEAAITEMLPWHRGGTASNLGLSWGWRTLSPDWRGLWDVADSELPHDYDEPVVDKVVIILTDGVNQVYDHDGGGPLGSDYTGFGRVGEGRVRQDGSGTPLTDAGDAKDELDRRMLETCTTMKDEGIRIYTITFQVDNDDTRDLFRDCASSVDHYFNSPSNAELQDTFTQIATELSNLRIAE